ncbi:hypothetical protein [Amaricoccus macauensis]|uniref:hypothetical protein n=1 Tax=Amaricoccus macauensis TaxID=57001 RepID=UPI003C7A4AED
MSDTHLEALISRFPAFADVIAGLHRDDPSFRSVCEEMQMAAIARSHWRDMPDHAEEFARIVERLEQEFLDAVRNENGSGLPRSAPGMLRSVKK